MAELLTTSIVAFELQANHFNAITKQKVKQMSTDVSTNIENTYADLSKFSYDELAEMEGAELAVGSDLKDKEDLIGVPFAITAIFFRPSDQTEREYVSVEGITKEGEHIVFNDGGLGIRETLVKWAVDKDILDYAVIENPDGPINDFLTQAAPSYVDLRFDENSGSHLTITLPRPLICVRGLRKSNYKAKGEKGKAGYRPAGTTYYIA